MVPLTIPGCRHGIGDIILDGIVHGDQSCGLHGIHIGLLTDHTMELLTDTVSDMDQHCIALTELLRCSCTTGT